jgi:hypothetical protein
MMAQQTVYQPTASQYASAATHLETPIHHIRIDGQRFAIVTSGNSDHVYWLPADGTSCPCIWWETTRTTCSHLLALELAALEQELAEAPVMADLYTRCARVGCGELTEGTRLCDEDAAIEERGQRMAAARARVVESWI